MTVWVLPWKTLRRHFASAPSISLPHSLLPASHHSLTTDQSPRPYVVMSCYLRMKGRGLSCPSAPVCGTFQCFNICMAVRQTIKTNLPSLRRKKWGWCELTDLEKVYLYLHNVGDRYVLMFLTFPHFNKHEYIEIVPYLWATRLVSLYDDDDFLHIYVAPKKQSLTDKAEAEYLKQQGQAKAKPTWGKIKGDLLCFFIFCVFSLYAPGPYCNCLH